MISLTDLNTTTTLSFTDNRPYGIVTNINYGKSITQEFTSNTFNIVNTCVIEEIIGGASANVRFEINTADPSILPALSGFPPGVTLITIGTKSTFYGIDSMSDYNIVKGAQLTIPTEYFGSFSYSVAIIWDTPTQNNNRISWQINAYKAQVALSSTTTLSCDYNVNYSGQVELESGFTMFEPIFNETVWDDLDSFEWSSNDTTIDVDPTPIIQDVPFGLTYWCVSIEADTANKVSNITSTTETGLESSSFSGGVYTIVGTRANINTTLAGLRITIESEPVGGDFNLVYKAFTSNDTNTTPSLGQFQYTLFQVADHSDPFYPVAPTVSYDEDTVIDLSDYFVFQGTKTGTYTLTIVPRIGYRDVQYIWSFCDAATSWSGGSQTFTATGTYTEIQSCFNNLRIDPELNRDTDFEVSFELEDPDTLTHTQKVVFEINNTHDETNGNFTLARNYSLSTVELLWDEDTPQITDIDLYPNFDAGLDHITSTATRDLHNVDVSNTSSSTELPYSGNSNTFLKSRRFEGTKVGVTPAQTIDLSGDFQMDFWVRVDDVTGTAGEKIFDSRPEGTTSLDNALMIDVRDSVLRVFVNNADRANQSVSDDTWYFVTIRRSGTVVTGYIGSTQMFSYDQTTAKDYSQSTLFHIGANNDEDVIDQRLTGYLDDFRIKTVPDTGTPTVPTNRPVDDDNTELLLYFDEDLFELTEDGLFYHLTIERSGASGPGFKYQETGTPSTGFTNPYYFDSATSGSIRSVINSELSRLFVEDYSSGGSFTVTVTLRKANSAIEADTADIIFQDTFSLTT